MWVGIFNKTLQQNNPKIHPIHQKKTFLRLEKEKKITYIYKKKSFETGGWIGFLDFYLSQAQEIHKTRDFREL